MYEQSRAFVEHFNAAAAIEVKDNIVTSVVEVEIDNVKTDTIPALMEGASKLHSQVAELWTDVAKNKLCMETVSKVVKEILEILGDVSEQFPSMKQTQKQRKDLEFSLCSINAADT